MNAYEYLKPGAIVPVTNQAVKDLVELGKQQADRIAELKKDRDRLFKAHSAEMVRADKLQAELDNLYDNAPLDWENE